MAKIYAAMEDELLVIGGEGDRPRVEHRMEGFYPCCLASDGSTPGLVYCGTMGHGLWRTADGGASWEPAGEGVPHADVTAVAVSAEQSGEGYGVVYAGTEPSALFRSEDGGGSWRELEGMRGLPSRARWSFPPRPETSHVRWVSAAPEAPDHLFVCIEAGALVRSRDGGRTWEDREPDSPIDTHTLAVHEAAPGRLYSAAGDGFFSAGMGYSESHDGGESWERFAEGLDRHYLWGLAVDPGDPDTIVVSAARSPREAHDPRAAESAIYRREGAAPWREVEEGLPGAEGRIASVLADSGTEPGVFYALNNFGVYRSPDAGKGWERIEVPWPERYLDQHPRALLVAGDY